MAMSGSRRNIFDALLAAAVCGFVQLKLNFLLAFGVGPVLPLVPHPVHRLLILCGVAALGFMAVYAPGPASAASALWSSFLRALAWSLLMAGLCFEFGTLLRFSTLPVPVESLLQMAGFLFAFLLVAVFTVLAAESLHPESASRS
jgi:hypothetical protein